MNIVVRIEYEQDDNGYWSDLDMSEVESIAANLAITPNLATKECGVQLTKVKMDVVEDYTLIDWHQLENYPQIELTK